MTARPKLAVVDDDDFDHGDDDFLAFWRQHRPPETQRIYGVDVEVPRDLPLNLGPRYEQIKGSEDLESFKELLGLVFGPGVLEKWIERGIGIQQVKVLVTWGMLNGSGQPVSFAEAAAHTADAEREAAGKAPTAPNRAARRASSTTRGSDGTGRSSKRTSRANTG